MKPNCYIDFDGTIVSNKKRLYQFFMDHIPEQFRQILNTDEFWALKRMRMHEIEWLNSALNVGVDKAIYDAQKIEEIEDEKYLVLDYLIDPSGEALTRIGERYKMVLVSRRTHPDALLREIERLEVKKYLDDIVIVPHGKMKKSEYIRSRYNVHEDDIMIGDTEDDIRCGHELGIKTYFVLSGIREQLPELKELGYLFETIESICELK